MIGTKIDAMSEQPERPPYLATMTAGASSTSLNKYAPAIIPLSDST